MCCKRLLAAAAEHAFRAAFAFTLFARVINTLDTLLGWVEDAMFSLVLLPTATLDWDLRQACT